jgi:hypothetical protein
MASFCAPIWVKFGLFGKISVNFGVGSAKIFGGNQTARIRRIRRISTIFHFSEKQNYCVRTGTSKRF